jgi:hypothetical protein
MSRLAIVAVACTVMAVTGCSSSGTATVRADRWVRTETLDGGRLQVTPAAGVRSHRTKSEALSDLRSTSLHHSPVVGVVATGWGRLTVRDDSGAPMASFNARPSWVIVFKTMSNATSCPAQTARTPTTAARPSGDYQYVQVFAIADNGDAVQNSQPASWFCGLPKNVDVATPTQLFATTWHPAVPQLLGQVIADIPDCVPQQDGPLSVPVGDGRAVAVRAFRPFPPAHCAGDQSVGTTLYSPTPDTVVSSPTAIECLQLSAKPIASPSLNCRLAS